MEIRVLGQIGLTENGRSIRIDAFKLRQLLAALAIGPGRVRSADDLIDSLWGETPSASAAKLLQHYISQLRRILPPPAHIVTRDEGYALDLPRGSLDSTRFEQLVEQGRAALKDGNPALSASLLRRALGLWQGKAFGDLIYESFVRPEAERLEELRLVALEERIEAELALGRESEILAELKGLAREHPVRERLQGQLMVALYRAGRQSEALDIYRVTRRVLRDELGLTPADELEALQRRILQHDPALLESSVALRPPSSLPAAPNALIGRGRELAELQELLVREDVRFVVLTGAGGSGKTRLAMETAHQAEGWFANGAAFVNLAPLNEPARVIPAISSALGLREQSGEPFDELVSVLRPLQLLLVLDNAEHLRSAAPIFVELLARAPRLTLLVTSRVVLHLSGEYVYPVEPLADEAAFALFLERAEAAGTSVWADTSAAAAIRIICRRLDGLPLGIELAASQVRTLSPSEILERLEPAIPLLFGGLRDLPARQQTLRATLEWSLGLLTPAEQRDFARLSVFVGGFTLQAAGAVCGTSFDCLTALVDHNLVRKTAIGDRSRYLTHQTIREFGLDKLRQSGEADDICQRHAQHFHDLARSANLTIDAVGEQRHEVVIAEEDNIRAAIAWAVASGHPELALETAVALEADWLARQPLQAIALFEELLSDPATLPPRLRAASWRVLGACLFSSGEVRRGTELYERSLAEYEAVGDEQGKADLLARLADSAMVEGNLSLARSRTEQSLAVYQRLGNAKGEATVRGVMADVERRSGRLSHAIELAEQSAAAAASVGHPWWEVRMLYLLGEWLLQQGRVGDAERRCLEALEVAGRIEDRQHAVYLLAILARIAAEDGRATRAGMLWGALEAEERRGRIGYWEDERDQYAEPIMKHAQAEFAAGRAQGRHLSLREGIDHALGTGEASSRSPHDVAHN
jgi:predicted ATPase/DNA-binding SARP family transcriptional activator